MVSRVFVFIRSHLPSESVRQILRSGLYLDAKGSPEAPAGRHEATPGSGPRAVRRSGHRPERENGLPAGAKTEPGRAPRRLTVTRRPSPSRVKRAGRATPRTRRRGEARSGGDTGRQGTRPVGTPRRREEPSHRREHEASDRGRHRGRDLRKEAEADRHRGVSGRRSSSASVSRRGPARPQRSSRFGNGVTATSSSDSQASEATASSLAAARRHSSRDHDRRRSRGLCRRDGGRATSAERDLLAVPADRIPQPGEPDRPLVEQRDPDHRSILGGASTPATSPRSSSLRWRSETPEHSLPSGGTPR